MINMNAAIIPFQGISDFVLYQNIQETMEILSAVSAEFTTEIVDNRDCTIPIPWTVLHISEALHLFFANDKLFKIDITAPYTGGLPNGIRIGMSIKAASVVDPELKYDDWNEDYESPDGYWLEDDPTTGLITAITVFIPEIDDDDFDECRW